MDNFIVSENAADRINNLNKAHNGDEKMLRIKVEGGGCNGLQYQLELTEDQQEDDLVFARNGAKVIIDKISINYLKDSEVDYVEDLGSASFVIKNPNSSSKCGCGSSFSYNQ
jgi:iron-sulfur cluster assembly accessory protein